MRAAKRTTVAGLAVVLFMAVTSTTHTWVTLPSALSSSLEEGRAAACPAQWRSILFSHTPKAAGSAVRVAVLKPELEVLNATRPPGSEGIRWCNSWQPGPSDPFPYNCLGLTREEHAAAAHYVRSHFGATCEVLSSHWDTSVLDHLDPAVAAHMLTVTILRHPVDRFYSDWEWLQSHIVRKRKMDEFLWSYHGFTPSNHMTLHFAGELGCRERAGPGESAPPPASRSREELLQRAKRTLDAFCVVMIQERMDESAALLRGALRGGASGSADHVRLVNTNTAHKTQPLAVPRDSALYRRLADLNDLDMELYQYAVQRFERDLILQQVQLAQQQKQDGGEGAGDPQTHAGALPA